MQENFEKFYQKIRLTIDQKKDARTKYTGVCKKLNAHYYPEKEYTGKTKFLIGSYGKRTNIRPPQDVDVIFILPQEEFARYDNYESNGQSALLQDIRDILSDKYTTVEAIRGWGKVVLIKFSDGTHDVELLPAWTNDDGTFTIPNSENGGSWEIWDPRSEIQRINDSDRDTGKLTRFLIRSIKKWKQGCGIGLKSHEIENFVVTFLESYQFDSKEYSTVVRDFFEYLKAVIDDANKSYVETAYTRAGHAYTFETEGKLEQAVTEWKKVFGDDFPSMELVKSSIDSTRYFTRASSDYSQKEQHIESLFPVRLNSGYNVHISCIVNQKGFRSIPLGLIQLLRKEKRLDFKARTNVESPYSMKWKVRNSGEEARLAGDLRGEISDDEGHEKKIEHTKYKGEHFVECYVIKDRVCVARAHLEVPISICR